VSASSATDGANTKTISVNCSGGKKLLGGGGLTSDASVHIYASYPLDDDTWAVSASETGSNPTWTLTAWAICASV